MKKNTEVAIFMGSDSDLKIMKGAAEIFDKFDVKYEIRILSAHRTPDAVTESVEKYEKQKTQVIIAGAGSAAHLAGVIAGHTILPVIGVPISASLDGVDALYSTVQMPSGIPVATVGIDKSKNAALIAVAILALSDASLKRKLLTYRKDMKKQVIAKDTKLQKVGYKNYD